MDDHTRNFFHISLSQENKFSFEGESGHFKSHIISKNVELSEIDNYFIITKMFTLILPFLWNVGLKTYFFDSFSDLNWPHSPSNENLFSCDNEI